MEKYNKSLNAIVFWRIVFTYSIMILHYKSQHDIHLGWYIAVEFFFVVSGWLLAMDVDKKDHDTYSYCWHRIKRLYPEYFFAYWIAVVVAFSLSQAEEFVNFISWFIEKGIYEMFMIHFWGWGIARADMVDVPTWYISVMLLAGIILYSAAKRFPNLLKEILLPIIIVVFLTYSYRKYGNIQENKVSSIYLHLRLFRGMAEMGLGYLLYQLNKVVKPYIKNSNMLKAGGFVALLLVVLCSYNHFGKEDFVYLAMICFGVIISFNTSLNFLGKYGRIIMNYFGELSYSLFLSHNIFRKWIFPYYGAGSSIFYLVAYLLIVTVYSIIFHLVVKCIIKYANIMFKNMKMRSIAKEE